MAVASFFKRTEMWVAPAHCAPELAHGRGAALARSDASERRVPKLSAAFYRDVVARNAIGV
ncbi:hypothetical protein ABIB06_005023 [Bradyrhizobium sp. LB8.2]|jgi:hypothetical protein